MAISQNRLMSASALSKIASVGSDEFSACATKVLAREHDVTVRSSTLVEQFSESFSDIEYATALCSQLVAVATIRRVEAIDDVRAFNDIINSLQFNGLSDDVRDWFIVAQDTFLQLMRMRNVRLVAKALHLSTDFSDLFISGNVVTDIRPVFESSREQVSGGLIVQMMRVHFIAGSGRGGKRELSLALDSDDISKLIIELEKAQKKSESARKFVAESLGENAFIVGEDTYGFG